jgi:hypothetical protein
MSLLLASSFYKTPLQTSKKSQEERTEVKWDTSTVDLWLCVSDSDSVSENVQAQQLRQKLESEFVERKKYTCNHNSLCL